MPCCRRFQGGYQQPCLARSSPRAPAAAAPAELITYNATTQGGINVTLARSQATQRLLEILAEEKVLREEIDVSVLPRCCTTGLEWALEGCGHRLAQTLHSSCASVSALTWLGRSQLVACLCRGSLHLVGMPCCWAGACLPSA